MLPKSSTNIPTHDKRAQTSKSIANLTFCQPNWPIIILSMANYMKPGKPTLSKVLVFADY